MMLSDGVGQSIPANTPHVRQSTVCLDAQCVTRPKIGANAFACRPSVFLYRHGNPTLDTRRVRTGSSARCKPDIHGVSSSFCVPHLLAQSPFLIAHHRFFVHKSIQSFAEAILHNHGKINEQAFLFPSHAVAARCISFLQQTETHLRTSNALRILDLYPDFSPPNSPIGDHQKSKTPIISAVIIPKSYSKAVKTFWQHSGDGVSSRRAEYCHKAYEDGYLHAHEIVSVSNHESSLSKGPRRYQKRLSQDIKPSTQAPPSADSGTLTDPEFVQFVEERFGRNLDATLALNAKKAVRERIAGALCATVDAPEPDCTQEESNNIAGGRLIARDDVYLYPCGMSAIFNTHRTLMRCRGEMKSICFGFPYIDTLKILEKWGPGCIFYGNGASFDLDDLESRCKDGERFLALFCEVPGNPLLKTPDLPRIRKLADTYNFAVIIDESIGNFINVHVLPYADIVVSSLTKVFTGECNVMGGSAVLNPRSRYYETLKDTLGQDYEDNYWPEDAIFMERNSRDFVSRIHRINRNAEMICEALQASPFVNGIYYPKYNECRNFYDLCRTEKGGYGGLLSVTFENTAQAVQFFDKLDTAKGPSLGTNFTLSSPYVILAHYGELEWAKQFGVDPDLIRISVGLEDPVDLRAKFERALSALNTLPLPS